jgi:hypothetical protein
MVLSLVAEAIPQLRQDSELPGVGGLIKDDEISTHTHTHTHTHTQGDCQKTQIQREVLEQKLL